MSLGPEREAKLFFALWPGADVRAGLAEWSRRLHALCGGRAIRPRDLHMTLAFLGAVPRARIGEIERATGKVAPRSDTLVLDRPGFWRHNRIVWAGASSVPAALDALLRDLREALSLSGIAFDAKPFAAHVTLLRNAREPQAIPALAPIRWGWEGFALAGSFSRSGGPYEILREWGR